MTDQPYKKKLIEVALPLDAINAESAREKSIRHGHPSTLHLWWARRPLAACRAVLFSQLVDDPSSKPEEFPTVEEQDAERERLFGIIEELVKWENTTNEEVLEAARAEIRKCFDGDPPPVLDPFAGGGSIPLEAQRLGLEAHASDLNPVAVLINKALIEIPPKFADQPPVHPDAEIRTTWKGAEGLAEDIRKYGQWMRDEAEKRVGHLYPKATLKDGTEANVIAWIWARTVNCPNPACGVSTPLVGSLWLGKKKGREAWLRPVMSGKEVEFEIGTAPSGPEYSIRVGKGAKFLCVNCQQPIDPDVLREASREELSPQLIAIAAEGIGGRSYLAPDLSHVHAARVDPSPQMPHLELSTHPQYMGAPRYGLTHLADLFLPRTTQFIEEMMRLISEVREAPELTGRASRGNAICTYLSFALNRVINESSTLATWVPLASKEHVRSTFSRQALPMSWDFAEPNPFGGSTGDFLRSVDAVARSLAKLPTTSTGYAAQRDARQARQGSFVVATDPPYYDNVPYADLSDFFYPWLRKSLGEAYGSLFATMHTPKGTELVADVQRHTDRQSADSYFENGFIDVFSSAFEMQTTEAPMTVFYAFKQSEGEGEGDGATGWSTMLEGLHAAGWSVSATWPMRTEKPGRSRAIGSNALASSVVLSCRPRPSSANVTDRQGFVRELRESLPGPIAELQKANIAPVDLRQAAIGPGMAVLSSFSRVIEADGGSMRVHTALGLINQVLESVLGEQEADFDSETRWAIQWFSQFYENEGPFGTAESLAVAMAVSVRGMADSGILESGGGKARLLSRSELPDSWDPMKDDRVPVWEATQHLIRRLESDGESAAASLYRQLERKGLAEPCKALAYRLYDICESTEPTLAGPYNMLAASWPEIQRLAAAHTAPIETVEEQQLNL